MPRTARAIEPGNAIYHVTCRGNNRAVIFHDTNDFLTLLDIISACKSVSPFRLYHYCIMNNHFHLEIEPRTGEGLAETMKWINQSYSNYYKKKYGFIGHLWQGRFHSRIITDESYLAACGIYIELNPVRAKIVDKPEEYVWSSYRHYAHNRPDPLVDPDPLYESLGQTTSDKMTEYRAMTRAWQLHPIDKKKTKEMF